MIINLLVTKGSSKCPITVFQDYTQANLMVTLYGSTCSQDKITDSSGNTITYRIWPIPAKIIL